MLNLLKSELRLIVKKKRKIRGYKSMSKNELINAINTSKLTKNSKKKRDQKQSHETLKEEIL